MTGKGAPGEKNASEKTYREILEKLGMRGVDGTPEFRGGASICICPKCGKEVAHNDLKPCNQKKSSENIKDNSKMIKAPKIVKEAGIGRTLSRYTELLTGSRAKELFTKKNFLDIGRWIRSKSGTLKLDTLDPNMIKLRNDYYRGLKSALKAEKGLVKKTRMITGAGVVGLSGAAVAGRSTKEKT